MQLVDLPARLEPDTENPAERGFEVSAANCLDEVFEPALTTFGPVYLARPSKSTPLAPWKTMPTKLLPLTSSGNPLASS
jgi:hypothetical protein